MEQDDDEDRELSVHTLKKGMTSRDVETPVLRNGYAFLSGKEDGEQENLELENSRRGMASASSEEEEVVYTVEDAVDHMGFGPFQILVTFFSGFIWMADAMELMLISVLGPILQCYWDDITNVKKAMISSVVFIGFLFGGFVWGILVDRFGRRRVLFVVDIVVLLFGLASALAPNYWLLLVFRFGAGFGIGGSAQSVTYYVEFLPRKARGVCITLLEVWWAVGSIFAAVLAIVVMPNVSDEYDWRLYLGLCAFPLAIVLLLFPLVPESARYYITHGREDKAMKVMRRVAWWNCKALPEGRLVSQEEKEQMEALKKEPSTPPAETSFQTAPVDQNGQDGPGSSKHLEAEPLLSREGTPASEEAPPTGGQQYTKGRCSKFWQEKVVSFFRKVVADLSTVFTGGMWKTTSLLIVIWFGCAWLYYGAVLLTTEILENGSDPHCHRNGSIDDNVTCPNLTTTFYEHLLWTTAAEFPGIIITLVIIELIGRKITMAVEFFATAVFFGLILICAGTAWTTVFLFGARGFATGVFQAVYVYTPEVYPTLARGSALGVHTAAARLGAILTPLVAQVLFDANDYVTISLYAGSSLFLIAFALLLPIETKGRSLKDLKA